jgi:hypothetical protein
VLVLLMNNKRLLLCLGQRTKNMSEKSAGYDFELDCMPKRSTESLNKKKLPVLLCLER